LKERQSPSRAKKGTVRKGIPKDSKRRKVPGKTIEKSPQRERIFCEKKKAIIEKGKALICERE